MRKKKKTNEKGKKRHGDPNTQLLFVSTCRHTYILAMVLEEVVVVVKKMTMFEKNNKYL